MKWQGRRKSTNVEDRRTMSAPKKMALGGGLGAVLLMVVGQLLGVDISGLAGLLEAGGANAGASSGAQGQGRELSEADKMWGEFSQVVLADTEDVWNELFGDGRYREPGLVLFSGEVRSACGVQDSAVGPFYCPADSKVYFDTGFFEDLRTRYGAAGDFAPAYVIAHEVGHHIQNLLGTSSEVRKLQQKASKTKANELSVRLELQADFYAGVFAHHAHRIFNSLEPGDIEEALAAANAIGDDTLQRRSGGSIRPDLFTHGTSEQRQRWFYRGYETGDPQAGDTFSVSASEL